MAYELPEKLKQLKPYEPVSGAFQVHLDANESFLTLPEELRTKIGEAMEHMAYQRYPDPNSTGVCKVFSEFFQLNREVVVAGNGSDELIALILSNFASYKDTILVTAPDFSMYEFYGRNCGLQVETLWKEEGCLEVEEVVRRAKETKAKIVLFSNPCNPTSLCVSYEQVIAMIEQLDCLVVVDEAYMDFSNQSIVTKTEEFDNVIVLKTCSKAFGLAAIRLGFAISNKRLTSVLKAVKSPYNVNAVTQTIGEIVLSEKEYLQTCIKSICKETKWLYDEVKKLEEQYPEQLYVAPTDTNFVFLDLKEEKRVEEVVSLMKEKQIAIRFMGTKIRISAGRREENQLVVMHLKHWLKGGNAK